MWWNHYEMRSFVKVFSSSWCRKTRSSPTIGSLSFAIAYACGLWMMSFIFASKVEWSYCLKIDSLLFPSVSLSARVSRKFTLAFSLVERNHYFRNKDRISFFLINSVGMHCWNIRMAKREILFARSTAALSSNLVWYLFLRISSPPIRSPKFQTGAVATRIFIWRLVVWWKEAGFYVKHHW